MKKTPKEQVIDLENRLQDIILKTYSKIAKIQKKMCKQFLKDNPEYKKLIGKNIELNVDKLNGNEFFKIPISKLNEVILKEIVVEINDNEVDYIAKVNYSYNGGFGNTHLNIDQIII